LRIFESTSQVPAVRPELETSTPHCLQLLLTCAESGRQRAGQGSVVAFTSATPGEGVSHVVRSFAAEIALQTGRRTLIAEAQALKRLSVADYMRMPHSCLKTDVPNLWMLLDNEFEEGGADKIRERLNIWQDEPELGLRVLSEAFDYTLIDCPSVQSSYTAATLGANVDGVILVVEADRTKRDQIRRAQQTIEMSNGKLLGLVLNKRRYAVPRWLYRML
jgi:Mrp family chromosome partitioning ATPase